MVKKKTSRPRSEKQLANDQRLRDRAEKPHVVTGENPTIPAPEPPADMSQLEDSKALEQESLGGAKIAPANSLFAHLSQEDKDLMMMNLLAKVADALTVNPNFKVDEQNASAVIDEVSQIKYAGERQQAQVGANGVTGQVYKYPVDKEYYPNPLDRLYNIPFLKRHNLRDNFILTWEVEAVEYEKNGVAFAEPRFIVHLYRRIYDEDGNDSGTAALVSRCFLHEDRFVTLNTANRMGITQNFSDEAELMDEVRFIRISDWLVALFTPYKFQKFRKKPRSMVIAGKQVEVFDTEEIVDDNTAAEQAASYK